MKDQPTAWAELKRERGLFTGVFGVFAIWAALVLFWSYPDNLPSRVFSPDTTEIGKLGQFGDSFGIVTALASSLAALLVFLTYRTQRRELEELRSQVDRTNRRDSMSNVVDRLEGHLVDVRCGNRQGRDLITWVDKEISSATVVMFNNSLTPKERWQKFWKTHSVWPDVEPFQQVCMTLVVAADFVDNATDETERRELVGLLRTVLWPTAIKPLWFTIAGLAPLLSDCELASLDRLFTALRYDKVFIAQMPISYSHRPAEQ